MARSGALGRVASHGLAACVVWIGAGCGRSEPAPAPDRFRPSRPTQEGSIGDAVRGATERTSSRPPRAEPRAEQPPRSLVLPPEPVATSPEPLTPEARRLVENYLSTLSNLNAEIAGISDVGDLPSARARVATLVDEMRSTLDGLVTLTAGQRLTVQREYGPRCQRLEGDMTRQIERLSSRTELGQVVTLVADVPMLDGPR